MTTEAGRRLLAIEHFPKGPCHDSPDCEHGQEIAAIEAEASRATLDAIEPWLKHAMTCASTEGYGVVDGERLTPQKPCDCGLDAVIQKQREGGAP